MKKSENMKYYYLMYDYEHEKSNRLLADSFELYGIEDYDFWKGEKIKWDSRNAFYFEEDGTPTDYLAHVHPSALVVSQKIKDIFENEIKIKDVEFFPIPLRHKHSNKVIQGYYIVNVLNMLNDALDREKSVITVLEADDLKVENIKEYCFYYDKIKEYDLFQLGDGYIFISEKVKRAFENTGVTGCDYGEVKLS